MESTDIEKSGADYCVSSFIGFREEFYHVRGSPWYRKLVNDAMGHLQSAQGMGDRLGDYDGFDRLLARLPHLGLPDGTLLDCGVEGDWMWANSKFHFILPDSREKVPVEGWEVGRTSLHAIWEKTILLWAEPQFYMCWHGGYSQSAILLGHGSFQKDIEKLDFVENFIPQIEEKGLLDDFKALDLRPRVTFNGNVPSIRYFIFTPFGGVFESIIEGDVRCDPRCVVPYDCGVNY